MRHDSRFHHLFPSDLATATRYYDRISIDLGNRFRDCVRNRIDAISDRPETFGFIRQPLRMAMVEDFPYILVFRLMDHVVFFAGLYLASSDTENWLSRNYDGE